MTETKRPAFAVGIAYRDPRAALAWLEAAFGFETTMVVEGDDGQIAHSEMRCGEGLVMIGREWDEVHKSPASIGGINTQSVHLQIDGDVDAHCERARGVGARIIREPASQFYGDRLYACADPEGHQWSFACTETAMSHEEMAKAGGVVVRERL